MKSKSAIRYFDIGPYGVYFGFTTSEKAFQRELKRLKVCGEVEFVREGAAATAHVFCRRTHRTIIVCLRLDARLLIEQYCGLLTHEAVHVWQEVTATIGEKAVGCEIEAYNVQNIAQFMMSAVLRGRRL